MLIEHVDGNFKLTFSNSDKKQYLADLSKIISMTKENRDYTRLHQIISEAKSPAPMADVEIIVDARTAEQLGNIANTMVRYDFMKWDGINESISNSRSVIIESKIPSIRTIMEQIKQEYSYRIKTVVELSESQIMAMENVIEKYELADIYGPRKTILQRNPLDFPDIRNAEVFIYDIKTYLPISAYILQQELRAVLGIPESFIVVRSENDPMEIETERLAALHDIAAEAEKENLERASLLDTVSEYPEADEIDGKDYYGDEYNSVFLTRLAQISATRKPMINKDQNKELFGWLDKKKTETEALDYIKDIEDAPTPVYKWAVDVKDDAEQINRVNDEGTVDDNFRSVTKLYRDKDGKLIKKTKDIKNPIRKED